MLCSQRNMSRTLYSTARTEACTPRPLRFPWLSVRRCRRRPPPSTCSRLARTSGMLVLVGLFCLIIGLSWHWRIPQVCASVKRPNWQKRPIPVSKETYLYGKRGLKISIPQVCASVKRDLFTWQKRPVYMAKEAYLYGKRGAFVWQKRPICTAKEAY